jgi:ketosteroid isomerase-like protein
MKRTTALVGLTVAMVAFCMTATAADTSKDVAAMHAVDQVWVKSYNAGDAATAANLYDEHAILMPPGVPGVRGRAAIREFLAKGMTESGKAGFVFALNPKPDGGASGDMGWVSGTYVVTDKSGKVVDKGKYLSVSQKRNGKWLYLRDTWNSDNEPTK